MIWSWNKVSWLSAVFLICSVRLVLAQSEGMTTKDSTKFKQKDIIDLFQSITHRQFRKNPSEAESSRVSFVVIPSFTYTIQTGLTGIISTGITFYTDNTEKISKVVIDGNYSQFHQYWITSNNNIFLDKPRAHLVGDIRFYKFPTQTYGLGPDSPSSYPLQIDYSYLRLYQTMFRDVTSNLFIGIGYNLDYHWNIKVDSVMGPKLEQFIIYQPGNHSVSSGITLNLLYDSRKNQVNPRNGTYANLQLRPNLKVLGSNRNWNSVLLEFRHYFRLSASSNNVLALWSYNDITISGTPPYLDLPSIGWDDYSGTGRGYAAGRYTGRDLIYFESEYRFVLSKNGLFGAVVFGNAASIPESISKDFSALIPGGGIGLRIKFNKFSDTNLCIDYGFGLKGSRGFFFNLGEIF